VRTGGGAFRADLGSSSIINMYFEGGFVLLIEGSDTILVKGRNLNINSSFLVVVTQLRPHRYEQM